MPHDHSHHHHVHAPGPKDFKGAFRFGILLNVAYIIVQIVIGSGIHSMALISDGVHNLSDVFGMGLSWGAFILLERKPTKSFTYGYGRATILAAYMNALLLFIAVGALGWEAILRLHHPAPVQGGVVAIVSGIGIIINGVTAMLFFRDRHHDLNIKATFIHMAGDALISLGVLVSGIIIKYTHWYMLDPLVSLGLLLVIVIGTWGLLRDSVLQILDRVPQNLSLGEIEDFLLGIRGVAAAHDLHVWHLTTNKVALTTHLIIEDTYDSNSIIKEIQEGLAQQFHIYTTTIQVEFGEHLEQ